MHRFKTAGWKHTSCFRLNWVFPGYRFRCVRTCALVFFIYLSSIMIQMKNSRRTTCTTWKRTVGAARVDVRVDPLPHNQTTKTKSNCWLNKRFVLISRWKIHSRVFNCISWSSSAGEVCWRLIQWPQCTHTYSNRWCAVRGEAAEMDLSEEVSPTGTHEWSYNPPTRRVWRSVSGLFASTFTLRWKCSSHKNCKHWGSFAASASRCLSYFTRLYPLHHMLEANLVPFTQLHLFKIFIYLLPCRLYV